jgi:hypothetical protein
MIEFNHALFDEPRFPIDINFYHDPEWQDLRKLVARFSEKA